MADIEPRAWGVSLEVCVHGTGGDEHEHLEMANTFVAERPESAMEMAMQECIGIFKRSAPGFAVHVLMCSALPVEVR